MRKVGGETQLAGLRGVTRGVCKIYNFSQNTCKQRTRKFADFDILGSLQKLKLVVFFWSRHFEGFALLAFCKLRGRFMTISSGFTTLLCLFEVPTYIHKYMCRNFWVRGAPEWIRRGRTVIIHLFSYLPIKEIN